MNFKVISFTLSSIWICGLKAIGKKKMISSMVILFVIYANHYIIANVARLVWRKSIIAQATFTINDWMIKQKQIHTHILYIRIAFVSLIFQLVFIHLDNVIIISCASNYSGHSFIHSFNEILKTTRHLSKLNSKLGIQFSELWEHDSGDYFKAIFGAEMTLNFVVFILLLPSYCDINLRL